jgi:hypothetical protein
MAGPSITPDDPRALGAEEEHEAHEPPRGALLITCGYLVLITALWIEVYLQLLSNGGVPRP